MTLAIIRGLLVKVCYGTYAIPLASVLEIVDCDTTKVNTVTINKRELLRIPSDILLLIRLSRVLKFNGKLNSLEDKFVAVVGIGEFRVGPVVDNLLGQQEIVIQYLRENLGHISEIAGITILGDGSVVMIIAVSKLIYTSLIMFFVSMLRKIRLLIVDDPIFMQQAHDKLFSEPVYRNC